MTPHATAQAACEAAQQELNGLGAQLSTARARLVMQERSLDQARKAYADMEQQIVTAMHAASERCSALQALASQMPNAEPTPEVIQPKPEQT